MKKYIIEVEENKAEIVASLLAQISVKINKSPEEKMTNYKIEDCDSWSDNIFFVSLTEEQVRLLDWLIDHNYVDCDLFNANPNIEFERI